MQCQECIHPRVRLDLNLLRQDAIDPAADVPQPATGPHRSTMQLPNCCCLAVGSTTSTAQRAFTLGVQCLLAWLCSEVCSIALSLARSCAGQQLAAAAVAGQPGQAHLGLGLAGGRQPQHASCPAGRRWCGHGPLQRGIRDATPCAERGLLHIARPAGCLTCPQVLSTLSL